MDQSLSSVTLPAGRSVDIAAIGPVDGPVVVYHHGTPTCRIIPSDFRGPASERGLRVIGYSRPGYGASTPSPGRSVADDAALLAELLDHLGVGEFVSVGWSGGGPHALAAAAALPGRCRAATVIAGVAPYGVDGLDFLDGMGQDNIDEFGAALAGEMALRAFLGPVAEALRGVTGEEVIGQLETLLPECDRAVLTGEAGEEMAAEMREALSVGIEGWVDDDLAFTRPWGFDLGAITTPVSLWQGSEDLMVPLAHGRWLAGHVRGARARELDGEGHLSLVSGRMGELFDELTAMAGWT